MTKPTPKVAALPEAEVFAQWVKDSIEALGMRPCHFLVEKGRPGSINRVSRYLRNPKGIKLEIAAQLSREIVEQAEKSGVKLAAVPVLVNDEELK
ncbi:MAG: hypothetical protein CSA70_03510 [Rhodobacterales bacterium]|nr:MAG: hypothetical protein CSA70_03510 [Rhodobacterales bacterium]